MYMTLSDQRNLDMKAYTRLLVSYNWLGHTIIILHSDLHLNYTILIRAYNHYLSTSLHAVTAQLQTEFIPSPLLLARCVWAGQRLE